MAQSIWEPRKPLEAGDAIAEHHRLRKPLGWLRPVALGIGAIVGGGGKPIPIRRSAGIVRPAALMAGRRQRFRRPRRGACHAGRGKGRDEVRARDAA